jgi:hypothetical protein
MGSKAATTPFRSTTDRRTREREKKNTQKMYTAHALYQLKEIEKKSKIDLWRNTPKWQKVI